LPKLKLAGLTVNVDVVAAAPVPVRLMVAVELEDESLLRVSLPVAAPEVVGLNWTLSVSACFGLSVIGKLAPETVNPVPLMAAAVTFTGAAPVEARVTDWVAEEPTVTLPKLKLPGLTESVGVVSVVPVPLRPIAAAELTDELLLMASLPVTTPAVVGLNCTVSVTVCFGFKVTGKLAPETAKPAPLMVAAVTCTGAVPVEARVTD
jgi:hypothetical protein